MGAVVPPPTLAVPAADVAASGPVLFARYAYPPNRLGLCGPADAPALHDGAIAGADGELRELARGFEGAFPYLRLIADQNGMADPLDPQVVESYWLGGGLSSRVDARALHRSVDERFRRRMTARDWRWLEASVGAGSRPIHAFHVLEVFPRAGLLRGGEAPIVATMDACRIRWGTILSVHGDELVVSAPRLELVDGVLRLAPAQAETVTGWWDESGPLGGARPGDQVSLHWGWACDRLSPSQLDRLVAWTGAALALANRSL
jgi:hypothetical protein